MKPCFSLANSTEQKQSGLCKVLREPAGQRVHQLTTNVQEKGKLKDMPITKADCPRFDLNEIHVTTVAGDNYRVNQEGTKKVT